MLQLPMKEHLGYTRYLDKILDSGLPSLTLQEENK